MVFVLFTATLFVSSCSLLPCLKKELTHNEVGSTHIAVLSVTRWDEYKRDLQPTFALSEQDALKQAVSDTLSVNQSYLDAFTSRLGIKLAPSNVLQEGFKKDDYAGADIPEPAQSQALQESSDKKTAPELPKTLVDPHLSYLAATALFQEVKLLNRYVTDAAIDHDYKAYVVRMQVTGMPKKSGLPYDAYIDLGFFLNGIWAPVGAYGKEAESELDVLFAYAKKNLSDDWKDEFVDDFENIIGHFKKTKDQEPGRATEDVTKKLYELSVELKEYIRSNKDDREKVGDVTASKDFLQRLEQIKSESVVMPRVIPLLVTDQVEAALLSQQTEKLRQITLAIAAAYAGIGAGVNLDSVTDSINRSLGRDYNSLLTVGRLSSNTLRVRLGARQAPGTKDGYVMTPQTHNVSFLLLLDKKRVKVKAATVHVGSKTRFVHRKNGNRAAYRDDIGTHKNWLVSRWSKALAQGTPEKKADLKKESRNRKKELTKVVNNGRLATYVRNEQYKEFAAELMSILKDYSEDYTPELTNLIWFDMSVQFLNEYAMTSFTVPAYPENDPNILRAKNKDEQTVILTDDSKTTSATIIGVKDLDSSRLSATWRFMNAKAKKDGTKRSYIFAATGAKLAQGGRHLILTFPSAFSLGLVPPEDDPNSLELIQRKRFEDGNELERSLPWRYQKFPSVKQKPEIKVQVIPETLKVEQKDGTRSLLLYFSLARGPKRQDVTGYKIAVAGTAIVDNINGVIKKTPEKLQVYEITGTWTAKLELRALAPNAPVKLTFISPPGYENIPSKEIKVLALPAK